jgi:hypothetical protein
MLTKVLIYTHWRAKEEVAAAGQPVDADDATSGVRRRLLLLRGVRT